MVSYLQISYWVDLVVDNHFEIDENAFLQRTEVVIRWKESDKEVEYRTWDNGDRSLVLSNGRSKINTHIIAEQFLQKYKNPDSKYVAVLNGDRNDLHLTNLCWCNGHQLNMIKKIGPRITKYTDGHQLFFLDHLSKLTYKQLFKLINVIKMWDEEEQNA